MPTVISLTSSPLLPGNKVETVFDDNDFGYLIDKYMGYDAKKHFEGIIERYEQKINELLVEIDDLKNGEKTYD
ncbi:MAG: hypothetical protein PHR82_09225 [Endomicrobiaceae bacterium]|jgi:hypothetical protein|nr:hypothetical protein [Endomicrobiaceae bacterium]